MRLFLSISVFAVGIGWFTGCSNSNKAVEEQVVEDLPSIEPTEADAPDQRAIKQFNQVREGASSSAESADWPQLFGPARTAKVDGAINPVWGDEGPKQVWSIPVGTGYGSPVIVGDKVIFNHRIGSEEIVQCVHANTGETNWEHRYPTTFECEMEYSDGPYGTPLVNGGDVFVIGGQSQLICLDLQTGRPRWTREFQSDYRLEDNIFPTGASPALFEELLIYNVGAQQDKAGIVGLNRETGETVWQATDHGFAYCSPYIARIHDQDFAFVVTHLGLVCLDPKSGEVDWFVEHRCRAPMSFNSVSPLVWEDMVLVVTGPGPGALCLKVNADRSYQREWKHRRVLDSQYNTLMLDQGCVFGFTAAGQGGAELRCVDFATGELKWRYHSLLRRGQGIIVGGAMVLLGERGHLASLVADISEPRVLAFTKEPLMSEPCYCSPAFRDGFLFLKDEERLACFSLRP